MAIREDHWRRALSMLPPNLKTQHFGAGLGAFPRLYAAAVDAQQPAPFEYRRENGNIFLRLNPAASFYLGQQAAIRPHEKLVLTFDLRRSAPGAAPHFILGEKSGLYSFRNLTLSPAARCRRGAWERHIVTVDSGEVGAARDGTLGRLASRPTTFALVGPREGGWIDVDNLHLLGPAGSDRLKNGDFSRANDYWFFTSDDHSAWRVENLGVHLLFEQGLLGSFAFIVLIGALFTKLAKLAWLGNDRAVVLGASVIGFLLIGLFGSLLDAPRLAMLFYWIAMIAFILKAPDAR
jgi:hypothetical protein